MAKKEVTGFVKLQIKGGQANPAPPVGPALGQRGINIMEFCKAFNEKTKDYMGKPVPVVITVYKDKKFDFVIKSPPASHFIKEAAKLKGGSQEPGRNIVASITKKQAEDIAKKKMKDLNAHDLEQATNIARAMITRLGMSKKLGPRTFGKREELVFLGREISEQRDYSDTIAETIDDEVHSLVQTAYEVAKSLLNENLGKLSALAKYLVEHESVEGEELTNLLNSAPASITN